MIINTNNKLTFEIKIKGIHSRELLNTELNFYSDEKLQQRVYFNELPLMTVTEAYDLFSWLKKFARKGGMYKSSLKLKHPGLAFKALSTKDDKKTLSVRFTGGLIKPWIKKESLVLKSFTNDSQLKKMAFALREQIKDFSKPGFTERIGLSQVEIDELVLTDTEKYRMGNRITGAPAKASLVEGIIVKAEIIHKDDAALPVASDEAFWHPYRMLAAKYLFKGNLQNAPGSEVFETAIKKKFAGLMAHHIVQHFKKSFFELDARAKQSNPGLTPGRIDDFFIDSIEKEPLYKEEADKFVTSVYMNITNAEIKYEPFTLTFYMGCYRSIALLFDYNRDKLLAFMKKLIPIVFNECLPAAEKENVYAGLSSVFKVKLFAPDNTLLPKLLK